MKFFEPHFLLLVLGASICLLGYGWPTYRTRTEPNGTGLVFLYWFILGIMLAVGAIIALIGIPTS